VKCRERKDFFIKDYIARNIHPARLNIKALIALVEITITKEGTLFRPELEFMVIVGVEIRPTCTTKGTKRGVVWFLLE
jgi:hypothetical protein